MENQTQKTTVAEELISEGRLKACETNIANELESLGFSNAAKIARSKRYPEIYEDRICRFLREFGERKLNEIDKCQDVSPGYIRNNYLIEVFVEGKKTYCATVQWIETPIEKYNSIPPEFVLEKLKQAKEAKCFDYFTIATLKFTKYPKPIEDPLLFGRIRDNQTRYFVAQWDNDLRLDDL